MTHTRGFTLKVMGTVSIRFSNSLAIGIAPSDRSLGQGEREMARQAAQAVFHPRQEQVEQSKLHPVDVEVGRRVRVRRLQLRMSQAALGSGLGISFQQIQKYESGTNRMSSSALYQIANVLDVPVSYFFETLPRPGKGNSREYIAKADTRIDFIATSEGQRLVDSFLGLPRTMRSKFIALLTAFATPEK